MRQDLRQALVRLILLEINRGAELDAASAADNIVNMLERGGWLFDWDKKD